MLNLLPQSEKTKLIAEYNVRFASTATIFLCALLTAALVGLLPTYISKKSEMKSFIEQKSLADTQNSEETLVEAQRLEEWNTQTIGYLENAIDMLKKDTPVSEVIAKIQEKKSDDVRIISINVVEKSVVIKGFAATRNKLIAFHESLKSEPIFLQSNLPISDLARSTDAEFTIDITMP